MSSNSFILAGSAGGAGNGYWTNEAGSALTVSNANGLNFSFESFANYPKLIRLTITGTITGVVAAAGDANIVCTIPLSALKSWLKPSTGPSQLGYSASTSLAGASSFPCFQDGPNPTDRLALTISADSTNLYLYVTGYVKIIASTSQTVYTTITYLAS